MPRSARCLMRYHHRRSPVCRYCYGKGHTRRFCPVLAARAAIAAEKPASERDYDEAHAITLHERNVAKAAEPRLCSYCSKAGHNRKHCSILKDDIARLSDYNRRWKQHIAAWLKSDDCPVKVGALLSHSDWLGCTQRQYTSIVLEVNPNFWKYSIVNLFEPGAVVSQGFVRGNILNTTNTEHHHSAKIDDTTNFCAPAGAPLSFDFNKHCYYSLPDSVVVSDGCAPVDIPDDWLENIDVSRSFEKGRSKYSNGIFHNKRPYFEALDELFKKFNIN